MKFCTGCNNMYYIQISEDNGNNIIYYCRNCGNKKETQNFNHIINKYTKLDPTLPRIYNVKCPNIGCRTNAEHDKAPTEVIYIRYDDINMKYLYMCTECDTTWKTDDNAK